jgi:hypothetical protein
LIDLAQSDAAGDRRRDVGEDQVHARGLHLTLVGFDRTDVLVDQRPLRIELLLGDRVLFDQAFIAFQIQPCVREQRLIALQISLHLLQGGFVRTRIDLCQRIALVHGLTLRKQDFLHDPADLRPDGHRGQRRDGAERRNAQLNVAGRDRRHRYGYRPVLAAASGSSRCRGLLMAEISEESNQQPHGEDRHEKRDPMPAHEGHRTARRRVGFGVYGFV